MALAAITNSAAPASEKVLVSWKRSVFVLNLTTEWQPSPQGIQQIPTAPLPAASTTWKKCHTAAAAAPIPLFTLGTARAGGRTRHARRDFDGKKEKKTKPRSGPASASR